VPAIASPLNFEALPILAEYDRINELSAQLVALKQERNRLALFCRLPIPALVCIFLRHQWARPQTGGTYQPRLARSFNRRWIGVMLVCQKFRSVAVGASELWNTICGERSWEVDQGKARMTLQARRAGVLPLAFTCESS
jgi:hypothetical protein